MQVSAAVTRAHESTQKAAVAAQEAEDAAVCKKEELSRLLAENSLLEGSGASAGSTESTGGLRSWFLLFVSEHTYLCQHLFTMNMLHCL